MLDTDQIETRYAKSGDLNIAYQVFGSGDVNLVLIPGWASHVENIWSLREFAQCAEQLAQFARVILLDRRGTGLSDPVTNPPMRGAWRQVQRNGRAPGRARGLDRAGRSGARVDDREGSGDWVRYSFPGHRAPCAQGRVRRVAAFRRGERIAICKGAQLVREFRPFPAIERIPRRRRARAIKALGLSLKTSEPSPHCAGWPPSPRTGELPKRTR